MFGEPDFVKWGRGVNKHTVFIVFLLHIGNMVIGKQIVADLLKLFIRLAITENNLKIVIKHDMILRAHITSVQISNQRHSGRVLP